MLGLSIMLDFRVQRSACVTKLKGERMEDTAEEGKNRAIWDNLGQ